MRELGSIGHSDLAGEADVRRPLEKRRRALLRRIDRSRAVRETMHDAVSYFAPSTHPDLLAQGDGGPLAAGGRRLFQHRFEDVAARHPRRTALIWDREEVSYSELD